MYRSYFQYIVMTLNFDLLTPKFDELISVHNVSLLWVLWSTFLDIVLTNNEP